MGLNTFSAFLDFAISLEKTTLIPPDPKGLSTPLGEFFGRLEADRERNVKLLQTILRENVTELVMEPCESLSESGYSPDSGKSGTPPASWERLLECQKRFLEDAARAVNLKEVKRSFEKLAAKKDRLLAELRDLGQG